MKVYLIYFKQQLYAYSDNKAYAARFMSERNSMLFNLVSEKIDEEEYQDLITKYPFLRLEEIILDDGDNEFIIIGTIKEDDELTITCEKLCDQFTQVKLHFLNNVPFKKKYKTLLDKLTTIVKIENSQQYLQIDTVKLFYHLFKNTFTLDTITNEGENES